MISLHNNLVRGKQEENMLEAKRVNPIGLCRLGSSVIFLNSIHEFEFPLEHCDVFCFLRYIHKY